MEGMKLVSFNVNGLQVQTMWNAIFAQLRTLRVGVCLIQEMHSTDLTAHIWQTECGGNAFFCHDSSNSCGVAILFSRDFNPKVIQQFEDPHGRILLLDIKLDDEIITLGSIYAPTQDRPNEQIAFLNDLQET